MNVNQRKMNNKLLSQITTFTNKEKEKISYLNYLPPTIDDSSSDMSCKFISCLMKAFENCKNHERLPTLHILAAKKVYEKTKHKAVK